MIQEIKSKKFKWVMVSRPTKKNLVYLWENFPMTNENLAATLPPLQRPRVTSYKDYLFVILQFPYFDQKNQEIKSSELDCFIGKNFLVTVTDNKLTPLNDLFDTLYNDTKKISTQYNKDLSQLFFSILNELVLNQFPMLNHISQDLDAIEEQILEDKPVRRGAIYQILRVKRNIVNFRKIAKSHKEVISKLSTPEQHYNGMKKIIAHSTDLIGNTVEVWASLENYKDTINALHETHESLITFRTNIIMKTLTIFSVIVFPLTLLAAIFGMNSINMPLVDHPYGFWIITFIMLISAIFLFGYFKHKRWI